MTSPWLLIVRLYYYQVTDEERVETGLATSVKVNGFGEQLVRFTAYSSLTSSDIDHATVKTLFVINQLSAATK